jgi:hypothetical protein
MNSCELPARNGLNLPAIRNIGALRRAFAPTRRVGRMREKSLWECAVARQPSA